MNAPRLPKQERAAQRGSAKRGFAGARFRLGVAASVLLLLAGCAGSPAARFYTLTAPVPPESPAAAAARGLPVSVGPVAIPALVDRPQIVVTVGPNEVQLDEYHRWASPLADAIGLAVVGHLGVLLPSPQVMLLSQSPGGPADTRVAIEVQRFDSVPGSHALVDAVFTVHGTATGRSATGRTTAREAVSDGSYETLAAAHSRAVARLAADIAATIGNVAPPGSSPAR